MSRRLAALAVLAVSLAPPPAAFAQTPPSQAPSSQAPSPQAAPAKTVTVTDAERAAYRQKLLASSAGSSFKLIMQYYPDAYATFETDMLSGIKRGEIKAADVPVRTVAFGRTIRERMRPGARRAPSALLIAFGREQLGVMKALQPVSARLCYEYVELGGASSEGIAALKLADVSPELKAAVDRQSKIQFEVAIAGEKAPAIRDAITQDDAKAVFAEYIKRGGDKPWLDALSSGQPRTQADDVRCKSAITWVESILAQPNERAARMLAG